MDEKAADSGSPSARPFGKKNPDALIELRRQRLYRRQLEGLGTRDLVQQHAKTEQISMATAWRDWAQVNDWNKEDMIARIQGMRFKLYHTAYKKGHLQVAAGVLDSLGRVLGEATPEQVAVSVPNLNIQIEQKKD